jgi:TonB-linked SusC/RagA family outer membrane protein
MKKTFKISRAFRMDNRMKFKTVTRGALFAALVVLWGISVEAQDTLVVRGQILNGTGQPVPNVAVGVERSFDLPVVTDQQGGFSVKTITGSAWLNVNPSSEYKDKRVFLNNRTELTIYLTDNDLTSGDDALTVIAQTILKRNMAFSYSELNTSDIRHTPVLSVDQYMQGHVAGMHVINRSGDYGSGAVTLLRGISSLNSNNQPLYIVDGIPISSMGLFGSNLDGYTYNPLVGVNPLDISKTTIIKDPTITSAYGSKASNGLVFIETLDPSATQTVIELDLRTGYSMSPSRHIPQLNATQHKTLVNEVLFSSGMREERIREDFPNLFLPRNSERFIDYQHNTNWQDLIFTNSVFQNLNINVKGGDEIARYGLSFGYFSGDGIIKATGYDGYNLRFVSLLNIFSWLRMNAGVSLSYNSSELKESGRVAQTSPILTSLGKSPMLNPFQYDNEGRELNTLAMVDEMGVSNPQAVIDNFEAANNNFNFTSTLGFTAELKNNLDLNTNFGLNYNVLKEQLFMPNRGMELYYNKAAINVSKAANNSLSSFYNNTYLRFAKTFGNDHSFSSNTGINIQVNTFEFDFGLTKNAHENDQYRMLQDGTNHMREIGGENRNWNWLSIYEYITYSYRDKYLLSASVSVDGSSRVGKNADNTVKIGGIPFGLFYAAGTAWRLSNEPFLRNLGWLEEMKLRLSYGRSGNDDIGESNATNYYNAIKFRETVGLYPAVIPNDQLTYETVSQLNAGLDIALLGSRLRTTIDVYESVTDNMLIYSPLKAYFGYDFRPENGGKMKNTGVDVSMFYRVVDHRDFKWDFQATWSTFKNEVIEIEGDLLVTKIQGGETVNMVGQPANSFYGYIYKGVFATTQEAQQAGLVNDKFVSFQEGDAIFADLSGPNGVPDGIINHYDKTVIGSSLPEFFGGVSNTFRYKRLALSAFFQLVKGNEVFNYVRYQNENMLGLQNQSTAVLDRWQYEGHVTNVPRALWNDPVGNTAFSSRWIGDGSYLRLKNVSLSYTIPNEFLTFKNAQFYIAASNVVTWTKYLGYDPEFGISQSQVDQGVDYGQTPQPRQFILGIKLGL